MSEFAWMFLTLAGVAAVSGFAWLALAMDAHWEQVHGGVAPPREARLALRLLGICGLLVSAVLCFLADRPSMATLVWVMLLSGAALSIALTLTWRPGLLRAWWPWGKA